MKVIKLSAAALCASLMLSSCDMSNTAKGGIFGGTGGAALGSVIGYLISKDGKGTAIGAAIGTAVGTGAGLYIGKRMDKAKQAAEQVANAKAEVLTNEKTGMKYVRVTFDSGILFATGNATLTPTAQASLNKFAQSVLATNTDMDVAIYGYTDNAPWRGSTTEQSAAKNLTLSEQRANSVYNYLLSSGARTTQIKEIKGFGEEYPVASNATSAGKAQNRRVEVYLVASEALIQSANAQ